MAATTTRQTSTAGAPWAFLRRWKFAFIALGIALIGIYFLGQKVGDGLDMPTSDIREAVIAAFAAQSPSAKTRLAVYFNKHKRETVAVRHFAHLCIELQALADHDDVTITQPYGVPTPPCFATTLRDEKP
jgi:hypothetical protein